MNAEDRYIELAAWAAGEPLPDTKAGARTDEPEPESRELESLVALLKSAELPPSDARRAAVLGSLRQKPKASRGPWISLIAASILVVVSVIATYSLRSRDKSPGLSSTVDVPVDEPLFHEVFAPRTWEVTDAPMAGPPPPAGAAGYGPDFLRPFAEQAEFTVLVPTGLPKDVQLMAARYRREKPGYRPFSFVWLEYAGPEGRSIVLQAPTGPHARQAIAELELPRSWRSASRTADGVLALVASPDLSGDALSKLARRLAPLPR